MERKFWHRYIGAHARVHVHFVRRVCMHSDRCFDHHACAGVYVKQVLWHYHTHLRMCVYTHTHTHTAHMGYLVVSPGVWMRHLETPKNGLNLGSYVFVYVYKLHTSNHHMCMHMVGRGMRSWTYYFFLSHISSSEKEKQKMWTQNHW